MKVSCASAASGTPQTGQPGLNGVGTIAQGFLENSNVQVVEEILHMIIAQHILAACFYGLNYPNTEEFAPYAELVTGGYCESFNIPTREELKKHGG